MALISCFTGGTRVAAAGAAVGLLACSLACLHARGRPAGPFIYFDLLDSRAMDDRHSAHVVYCEPANRLAHIAKK